MKKLYLFLTLLVFVSCEKELDIDYHKVAPLAVVEGGVMDNGCDVRLTTTLEMADSTGAQGIKDAKVVITSLADGSSSILKYKSYGHYVSTFKGEPGNTYQLDIWQGDNHFSALSTMPHPPVIKSFIFQWQEIMGRRIVMADLRFLDTPNEENYYYMNVYRNGESYRWTVIRDILNPGGEIQQVFGCMSEEKVKDNKPEDQDQILNDGDKITIELASIDRITYDYLYALQLSGRSSSNPVSNISGGCLGCFWAAAVAHYECTYQTAEIISLQ